MDRAKSNTILVREFIDLLQGKRLDKKDVRQALTIINEVSEDVKRGNVISFFRKAGTISIIVIMYAISRPVVLKLLLKTKAPIIPVALIDSYKVLTVLIWDL